MDKTKFTDYKKAFKKFRRHAHQVIAKNKRLIPKRALIFLGSGAAIPWGAPSTSELDALIRDDTRYTLDNGDTVGSYLFNELRTFYGNTDSVNFETVISVLERILGYFMDESATGGTNTSNTSFTPHFFQLKDLVGNLKDYRVTHGNPPIQRDGRELVSYISPRNSRDTPSQEPFDVIDNIFFSTLLRHYLKIISDRIFDYDNSPSVNEPSDLNENFIKFVNYLISKNYYVRIYTTNYDRLGVRILKDSFKVFDGFTDFYSNEYHASYLPNTKKILNDYSCVSYYNLHGSIYWGRHLLRGSFRKQFICTPNNPQTYTTYPSYEPGNPGEHLMITNIITGYNKTQRIAISPLNALYNSFGQDCANTDLVVTIGTSFSDPHLNNTLAYAYQTKKPRWINIIRAEGDYFGTIAGDTFYREIIGADQADFSVREPRNNWIVSDDKLKSIYISGFNNFLTEQEWSSKI